MVSRDFQTLAERRAKRARHLAGRYPASCEALNFLAEIVSLQSELAAAAAAGEAPSALDEPRLSAEGGNRDLVARTLVDDPLTALDSLLPGRLAVMDLVERKGPRRLRDEAARYDEGACRESLRAYFSRDDIQSPRSFFARVLLQPAMFAWDLRGVKSAEPAAGEHKQACPRCGHRPQAGCLRPHGDGTALALVCSLCLHEWPFTRLRCPSCAEGGHHKLSFYSTAEFPHLEVQVCASCNAYLHLVHLEKEPEAVTDVDELAALPLDVWAQENGYWKIQPNLAGI